MNDMVKGEDAPEEIFYLLFRWYDPGHPIDDNTNYWACEGNVGGVLNPLYCDVDFIQDITKAARFTKEHSASIIIDDIEREHHDAKHYTLVTENDYILYRMGVK